MRKTVAIAGVATSLMIIFGGAALAVTIKGPHLASGIDSITGTADADTIKAGAGKRPCERVRW